MGPALVPLGLEPATIDTVVGDATDAGAAAAAVDGCDAVVHAAATVALTASAAEEARRANTDAAREVLGAAVSTMLSAMVPDDLAELESLPSPPEEG